jgi:hypothetical protein
MPIDPERARALHEWLGVYRSMARSAKEQGLLESVRRRTNEETALTALEQVASRQVARLDALEKVIAIVADELLAREPLAPAPAVDARDERSGSPYRGGYVVAPPGFFVCRGCSAVLPESQACASADGRFCVSCFQP